MEGILISLKRDREGQVYGKVYARQAYSSNDDTRVLPIYFNSLLPHEIEQLLNCTVEFDIAISKTTDKPYAKFISVMEDFKCEKTIRELYYLAPSWSVFELQVWDESSEEMIDSLRFGKNNDREEIESNEKRLYELIGRISRASCGYPPRYDMSIEHSMSARVHTVKVYVSKESYTQ